MVSHTSASINALFAQVNIYKSLQDIAAGMDYLHTVGVLHGDLKGANVLLKSTATDPRGFMCKLADFGLSRVLDLDMTHISTHTYGTISYMPPELLSQGKMTRAADVYSFGMLSKSYVRKTVPFCSKNVVNASPNLDALLRLVCYTLVSVVLITCCLNMLIHIRLA